MSIGDKNYNYGLVHKEPSFKHCACILLTKKDDARNALDLMLSLVNRNGYATVYDLYLAIGAKTSTEDDFIGWTDLDRAVIKPTFNRKEYRLILPKLDYDSRDYDEFY